MKLIKMIPIIMIMSQAINRETLLMPSKMKTTYRKLLTKSVNPLMKNYTTVKKEPGLDGCQSKCGEQSCVVGQDSGGGGRGCSRDVGCGRGRGRGAGRGRGSCLLYTSPSPRDS